MSSDHAELLQERAEYAASQAPTPSDIKLRDDEIRRINNAIQPPCTELEQAIQLRDVYRADLRNVERAIEEAKKTNSGVSTENITRAENRAASIKDDIAEIDAQIGGFVGKHATLFHNPERTPEEQAEYENYFELYVKRQELVDEYEQVEEVKPTTQEGIACRASNRERCKAAIAAIDAKLEGKASEGGMMTSKLFLDEVQAKDLSVTLIYKPDAALPDRLRLSANGMTTQTKSFGELGLIDKRNGQPKRTVLMLMALYKGKVAENVNAPQTFTDLRNLLRGWGVQGELFGKPNGGYRPYFKLRDGKDTENRNATIHADYERGIDDMNDAADEFLREHDR